MQDYLYTAILPNGKKYKGLHQTDSEISVRNYLQTNQMVPISIKLKEDKEPIRITNPFARTGYHPKELVFFTRQFATMLNAGLTVTTAIGTLKKQKIGPHLKTSLESIYEDVNLGVSLSQAMNKEKNFFPPFLLRMIEVGEVSGNLDNILERLADFYEREFEVNKKIKGALIYPAVVLVVAIMMLVFILIFVLPSFETMFTASGAELPGITLMLLAISKSLQQHGLIYLGAMAGFFFIGRAYLRSEPGYEYLSRLKLRMPFIRKKYLMIVTSRFARTMQLLLSSGITITYALEVTANVMDNSVLKKKVLQTKEEVSRGELFSKSLERTKIFPDILLSMVEVGEASGSLDDMLEKSSSHFDKEMANAIDQMIKMIEPAAILLVAVLVGFAVFAILMPMLDMIDLY
jgi:type IV pilus assembly protein PilC